MSLPNISSYGNYSSSNYGAHTLRVEIESLTVWFSYSTPIAFRTPGLPIVVRENVWGKTTGKHLNWIDGGRKSDRISTEKFEKLWAEHVKPYFEKKEKQESIFSGLINL
jgi:hypothetical protein